MKTELLYQYKSKIIESDQLEIHPRLERLVQRHKKLDFKKPFEQNSLKCFELFQKKLSSLAQSEVILDMCCGVGESSYYLAKENPQKLVVGIDKSASRLNRKNAFKKKEVDNVLLLRADLYDLWRLFYKYKDDFKIRKQFLLYPNPYPKQKHFKLRWQASAIFPFIMGIQAPIELRSNWPLYLEEFLFASQFYGYSSKLLVESFEPERIVTAFERKYFLSQQKLYRLVVDPPLCP